MVAHGWSICERQAADRFARTPDRLRERIVAALIYVNRDGNALSSMMRDLH